MSDKKGPITQGAIDAAHGIKDCAVATGDAIADTKVAQAIKKGAVDTGHAISEKTHEAIKKVSEH